VAITEAVCFVLKESPRGEGATETLPLDQPLIELLGEALRSAEGDESDREKPRLLGPHARGVSLDVRLRVVSIELLCAAMPSEQLKAPAHAKLRNRMISCFFKSLTVRSEEVVSVAKHALASVIAMQKLQKELLQSSLRPILLNLADYRKLSVPLLQGLSRLLCLLSTFFNLTLGEKLLEHLRRWIDPDTVNKAKAFKPGDEIKIPGAILSLFHLLPPAPNKFLEQLVTVTMDLDAGLPGSSADGRFWSQYREALLPYINRHSVEAVAYFLDRLADTRHFRMLLSYVRWPDAAAVRTELAAGDAVDAAEPAALADFAHVA
jgi:transformation/transcription domain-associated protein